MRSGLFDYRAASLAAAAATAAAVGVCWFMFAWIVGSRSNSLPVAANHTKGLRFPIYPGEYGVQAVNNLSSFRSTILKHAVQSFKDLEVLDQNKKLARYDAYPVTVACPPGQEITVMGNGEGVKYACDVRALIAPCFVYAFGSQGDYAFEMDAMRNTPCEIHTFDCTYDGQDQGPRHHYHKLCLGDSPSLGMPESAIFKTYTDILAQLDHRHTKIDVLKVDIEGYEFQALAGLLESTPYLPSQILVEVHFAVSVDGNLHPSDVAAKSTPQMSLLFAHFANLGYAVFHRVDNLHAGLGCCAEFSLLRVEGIHVHTRKNSLAYSRKLELSFLREASP